MKTKRKLVAATLLVSMLLSLFGGSAAAAANDSAAASDSADSITTAGEPLTLSMVYPREAGNSDGTFSVRKNSDDNPTRTGTITGDGNSATLTCIGNGEGGTWERGLNTGNICNLTKGSSYVVTFNVTASAATKFDVSFNKNGDFTNDAENTKENGFGLYGKVEGDGGYEGDLDATPTPKTFEYSISEANVGDGGNLRIRLNLGKAAEGTKVTISDIQVKKADGTSVPTNLLQYPYYTTFELRDEDKSGTLTGDGNSATLTCTARKSAPWEKGLCTGDICELTQGSIYKVTFNVTANAKTDFDVSYNKDGDGGDTGEDAFGIEGKDKDPDNFYEGGLTVPTEDGPTKTVAHIIKANATGQLRVRLNLGLADENTQVTIRDIKVEKVKLVPELTAPTASAIKYGQTLSGSELPESGTAKDPIDGADVEGNWSWADESTQPAATGNFSAIFTPNDTENYKTNSINVEVTVEADQPDIVLYVPAQAKAGEEVTVTCTVTNKYDSTKSDVPTPTLTCTYTVGDDTTPHPVTITGGKFTIPSTATSDTTYTVTATTNAVSGKYTAPTSPVTKTVKVTDKTPVEITGLTAQDGTYNAETHKGYTGTPAATGYDGGFKYTYTGRNETTYPSSEVAPADAGDYTVTVTLADETTYTGRKALDFTIAKATQEIVVKDGEAAVSTVTLSADDAGKDLTVTVTTAGDPGTVTIGGNTSEAVAAAKYENGKLTITPAAAGETTITIKAAEDTNHEAATATVAVKVTGVEPTIGAIAEITGSNDNVTVTPNITEKKIALAVADDVATTSNVILTLTAKDADGNTVGKAVVTLAYENGKWTVARPAEGKVTFGSQGDEYTVTIAGGGEGPGTEKTDVALTLTASSTSLAGGGSVTLTVGGVPSGATGAVTVTCDEKNIQVTQTTANNSWTATLPADVKTYTFTASFAGDDSYNEATATVKVNVTSTSSGTNTGTSTGGGGGGGGGSSSSGTTTKPSTTTETKPNGTQVKTETTTTTKSDGTKVETVKTTETGKDGSKVETTTTTETKKDGTKVETVKTNETTADGTKVTSTNTTETKKDGTKVETSKVAETKKDGTKTEIENTTETKSDGSKVETTTQTVTDKNGKKSENSGKVETTPTGDVKAEVKVAPTAGGKATAPIAPVTVKNNDVEVKVSTGSNETTKVEIPVEDVKPGMVAILVNADGTTEILKTAIPSENGLVVPVSDGATIKLADNSKSFQDMGQASWANNAVDFVSARGMFSGTSTTEFSPNENLTRAQMMTVLARYEGVDTSGGATWFEKGMEWAKEKGVSDGTAPEASINREQMIAMLWRYAGSPKASSDVSQFTDSADLSDWAREAMAWAIENGIISGMGDNTLAPQGTATRAQVASILQRFVINVDAQA